jgi:glyoxylase-like metal-dependent hydrolase (beta-lactamase superfamily II)
VKLHFANSAFIKAPERLIDRDGSWFQTRQLRVRYGILEHPGFGPVLIDTGYSSHLFTGARSFGLRAYAAMFNPVLEQEGEIAAVLRRLGYSVEDVRKIVVTHFHADHVSALRSLPKAQIIADRQTLTTILGQSGFANMRHGIFPELLPDDVLHRVTDVAECRVSDAPLDLGAGRDLLGDGTVIAVDLPGHAAGHFGLCFPWLDPVLLYACDVQWMQTALDKALPLLGRMAAHDAGAAVRSSRKVAEFRNAGGQVVLCHDPVLTSFDLEQPADV